MCFLKSRCIEIVDVTVEIMKVQEIQFFVI